MTTCSKPLHWSNWTADGRLKDVCSRYCRDNNVESKLSGVEYILHNVKLHLTKYELGATEKDAM